MAVDMLFNPAISYLDRIIMKSILYETVFSIKITAMDAIGFKKMLKST